MLVTVRLPASCTVWYQRNNYCPDDYYGCYFTCVSVAIASRAHIPWSLLWEFFSCRLVACLFVGEHMFSQIRSMSVGIHDPFFVATNADHTNCVDIVVGTLQRWENIKRTSAAFLYFLDQSLGWHFVNAFNKLKNTCYLDAVLSSPFFHFPPLSEAHHINI